MTTNRIKRAWCKKAAALKASASRVHYDSPFLPADASSSEEEDEEEDNLDQVPEQDEDDEDNRQSPDISFHDIDERAWDEGCKSNPKQHQLIIDCNPSLSYLLLWVVHNDCTRW